MYANDHTEVYNKAKGTDEQRVSIWRSPFSLSLALRFVLGSVLLLRYCIIYFRCDRPMQIAKEDEFIEGVIRDSTYDKIVYEHSKIVFEQQNKKYAELLQKYMPTDEGSDHFIEINCEDYASYE